MKKHLYVIIIICFIVVSAIGAFVALPKMQEVSRQKEAVTAANVKKFYDFFTDAFNQAVKDNGPAETWLKTSSGSYEDNVKLANIFKPYMNLNGEYNEGNCVVIPNDKEGNTACFAEAIVNCSKNQGEGKLAYWCGVIQMNVNGITLWTPKIEGKDWFSFVITKDGIVPSGTEDEDIYPCSNTGNWACTAWALEQGNLDYLH